MAETIRGRPAAPPLVGREHERALLSQALDEAAGGLCTFVLIEGRAGIGKSRLAREVAAIAAQRGFKIFVGSSSKEERGTAYAPLIDAMRDLRRHEHGREQPGARALYEVLIASGTAGEESDASTRELQIDRTRVTDAMLRFVGEASPGEGFLAVIEDVQWADHGTMRLLSEVSRHADDLRCVFVLTYRDDEVADNDALIDLLHALTASSLNVHTLRPRPLTWSETRTMAQRTLGTTSMPLTAFVDRLYARAEGNPFFTEEILRFLPDGGPPEHAGPHIPDRLPVSLTRLLERRIRRLPAKAALALTTAAVLGRRFDQETLQNVSGVSRRALLRALHDAVDAHLIRDAGDGRTFEFEHALVREAAEGMLLSPERRTLHRRVAEELEARGAPSLESAAIAYHYSQAGLPGQFGRHAVAAADAAWRAGAPMEAAKWYEQALAAATARGEDETEAILRRAAEAFAAARLPRLASDTFERLIERQRARGDVLAEGETLAEFANMFHGDLRRRKELLERALQILEPLGETASLARVHARLASLYVGASLAQEALASAKLARDMGRSTGATDAEAVAQRVLGTVVAAGGDFADGCRRLRQSIELAKAAHKHMDVYLASLSLVNVGIRARDWALAEATARESIDYTRRFGAGSDAGSLMARLAEVMRITGRVGEALRTIDEALLLLDQDEAYIFNAALLVKADVLADLGLWHAVSDIVEPLLPEAEQSGQFHIHGVALFLLARAAYDEGHLTEAADLTERVLEAWRQTEDNYYGLPMLLFACRLRCEEGALAEARALIGELRAVKHALTAGAIISAAEARLAVSEGRLDDAVRLWEGSATSFEEVGRPVDACRARLELGRTLLARGGAHDRVQARTHLMAVQSSFNGFALPEAEQAAALLRRHRLISARSGHEDGPLTAREREIVALVAKGLTNRRIAAELTLSARTVDNHVSRILNKLQLGSRGQIIAYAIEHGVKRGESVK